MKPIDVRGVWPAVSRGTLCFAILLLSGLAARAQHGTLTGSVRDSAGQAVGQLVLHLEPDERSAATAQKIKVNKQGKFAHRFVPTAKYTLSLEGADVFIESMVYVIRDSTNLPVDRLEAKAHPERGLPPIDVLSGQIATLDLVVASESFRAELSQRVAISEASKELQRATDLLNAGKLDESLAESEKILKERPEFGSALFLRGAALFRLGRLEEAEADLRRAIAAMPEQPGLHSTLGDVLLTRADRLRREEATREQAHALFDEAANLFQFESQRHPGIEAVLRNQVIALHMSERHDELRAPLEALIELAPADKEFYLKLAELSAAEGDYDAALATLERMPGKGRESAELLFNFAVRLYNDSRYDEAIPVIERAMAIDPDFSHSYRLLAGIRLVEGDRDAAIAGLRKFLTLAPEDDPNIAQVQELLQALQGAPDPSANQ